MNGRIPQGYPVIVKRPALFPHQEQVLQLAMNDSCSCSAGRDAAESEKNE